MKHSSSGAEGYLLKSAEKERLILAILLRVKAKKL